MNLDSRFPDEPLSSSDPQLSEVTVSPNGHAIPADIPAMNGTEVTEDLPGVAGNAPEAVGDIPEAVGDVPAVAVNGPEVTENGHEVPEGNSLPNGLQPRELARHLVAVLFAGGGPVRQEEAARALGVTAGELEIAIQYLWAEPPLGLRVIRHEADLELVSDPGSARYVEALLGLDRPVRLSRAALETLAIVAYRQPVTRGEVEAVRGVNSDSAVTTLLNRGMISEVGRKETVGRPALYGSTSEFLQHLGLDSLEDLPKLPE